MKTTDPNYWSSQEYRDKRNEYVKANHERIYKAHNEYWQKPENNQRLREYRRKHYQKHGEEIRAKSRAYYELNKEKIRKYHKEWRLKNPNKYSEKNKDSHFKRRYGISSKDRDDLALLQENKCLICNKTFSKKVKWCVDHDHKTGKIRGILCDKCNRGIACFEDTVTFLEGAIRYLNQKA